MSTLKKIDLAALDGSVRASLSEYEKRINDFTSRLTPNSYVDAADLRLTHYEMISSLDAMKIFGNMPELNIIFVYFPVATGENLAVCFQRVATRC